MSRIAGEHEMRRVLVADIGGTNSRFALFELAVSSNTNAMLSSLRQVRKRVFPTQENRSASEMIAMLASLPGEDGGYFSPLSAAPEYPELAVLAVPGPASMADPAAAPPAGDVCYCPNIPWPIPQAEVSGALGGMPVRLINDFVAQGFAAALLPDVIDAVPVLPGMPRPGFPVAVIGAGTGLGHCVLLPGETARVLGSEAGHTLFPFTGEAEREYARFLAGRRGTEVLEREFIVSGSGLVALYAFHAGETLHTHDAPEKSAKHPKVLEWIARFYGRVCREYVLATLSLGGIYITGGLADNLPQLLSHPAFAEELRASATMGHLLASIPVWRIRNQNTGLAGAAAYAALVLRERDEADGIRGFAPNPA